LLNKSVIFGHLETKRINTVMWIRIDRMQIRIHKIWSMRIRIQVNRNFFSKQVLIFRSKKNLLIFKSESKPLRLARIRRMSAMMSSFSDLKIINSISCIIESALLLFLLLPKRKKMLVQLLFFLHFIPLDPDPDPQTKMNADRPVKSGSTSLD